MPFDSENYRPIPEGHRRLLVLAEFLETRVAPRRFNIQFFANGDLRDCGTAGCAVGWASAIPEFQALGMTQKWFNTWFNGESGHSAAELFFGLPWRDEFYLFGTRAYLSPNPSPQEVAARIRAFVAKEQAKSMPNEVGAVASNASA